MAGKTDLIDEMLGILRRLERTGKMDVRDPRTGGVETKEFTVPEAILTLITDPEYTDVDWMDLALRRVGGVARMAELTGWVEQTIRNHRKHHWATCKVEQVYDMSEASGIPVAAMLLTYERWRKAKGAKAKKIK